MNASLSLSLASVASLAVLFSSNTASASDDVSRTPPPTSIHERREIRASVGTGVFSATQGGGFLLDGELLHRRGLLALGAVGDYGTTVIMPPRSYGLGGGGGISIPTVRWLRIDLLGVFGARRYENVGGMAIAGVVDKGADATLPYLGARAGLSLELGAEQRFVIGIRGGVDRDLMTVTRTTTAQSVFFTDASEQKIGGTRISGLFTLGGSFDL